MKAIYFKLTLFFIMAGCISKNDKQEIANDEAPSITPEEQTSYFIDVHDLEPGKVKVVDVANAHLKDLATQDKYGVNFIRYWVDEQKGKVYCLSKASTADAIKNTHKEAHGLLPSVVYKVTDGPEAAMLGNKPLFLDVHQFTPGSVKAKDVAGAHEKDLAVEKKFGVNFINYWVDEKDGVVMCLSEAPDSNAVKSTHKEAHGLLPAFMLKVVQGQ